jgi:predicted anti-sigma-YlaC factor YlaD
MNSQSHLTHKQLCDLLIADPEGTEPELAHLDHHLRHCPDCMDEYAALCLPLENFRCATTAWASHSAAARSWAPATRSKSVGHLVGWILATAALALAVIVPITVHEHTASRIRSMAIATSHQLNRPSITLGDEALLEEVDQTVSSSIPSPMQPLADPTGARTSQTDSSSRKN